MRPEAGAGATVAVIILTFNEELHLARALASVAGFAAELIVVDSFSTDRTVEIARDAGARVLQRRFDNQARQFNWALDTAEVASDWILKLDADEIIEPDLAANIVRSLPDLPSDVVGINFKRKHIFMDRWLRHGGRYPVTLMRLWRRGHGRSEDRWMDEHMVAEGGRTMTLDGGFADHNLHDLGFFIDKHNKYATREAVEVLSRRYGLFSRATELTSAGASRHAATKRWMKQEVYGRLPWWFGPAGYFLFRMTVQLGFLDGREGLIYHFLQGFWYRFLVEAKVYELDRAIASGRSPSEKLELLRRATGLPL